MENSHLLYFSDYQLDKDKKGGNIYSLENCVVVTADENRRMAYVKQQRKFTAIYENEKITYLSITEGSHILDIPRNTVQYYLKNGKQHPSGYRFQYNN